MDHGRRSKNGEKPILTKTRQLPILIGSLLLSVVGFAIMMRGLAIGLVSRSARHFQLVVLGVLLTLLFGLAVPALLIRCPRCKDRWFWRAAKSERPESWLLSVFSARECPACGYEGQESDHDS